jgi:hypothetical protein
MNRALALVIGLVVCLLGTPVMPLLRFQQVLPLQPFPRLRAAPASPDGWVVLLLDEYRALRERGCRRHRRRLRYRSTRRSLASTTSCVWTTMRSPDARFVKPLVIDRETFVTLRHRQR